MELLHHIWRLLLDGELLHSKPKKLDRVLDIGTGESSKQFVHKIHLTSV